MSSGDARLLHGRAVRAELAAPTRSLDTIALKPRGFRWATITRRIISGEIFYISEASSSTDTRKAAGTAELAQKCQTEVGVTRLGEGWPAGGFWKCLAEWFVWLQIFGSHYSVIWWFLQAWISRFNPTAATLYILTYSFLAWTKESFYLSISALCFF